MNSASRMLALSLRHSRVVARPTVGFTRSFVTRPTAQASRFNVATRRAYSIAAAPKVTYEQLKPRTENPTGDFLLVDVRETDEVVQGSIPSSVSLPVSEMPGAFKLHPAEFQKKYGFTMPEPNTEMIFYCRSGKRSTTACESAAKNGFKNVKNYEGSWLDWVEKEGKQ